jgi:SAM-dependent methyltransferase
LGLTVEEWHRQFLRQARWTSGMRSRLYRHAGLWRSKWVLDVGCGTGVLTEELAARTQGQVVGLDINPAMVKYASDVVEGAEWVVGDAHHLPFPDGSFDVVVCHFLLLWTEEPALAVTQMARVVRAGGWVLAAAEPDYGGRVDYPEDIALAPLMEESLLQDGGHPRIGRRLKGLFAAAGLDVQVGVMPSMWDDRQLRDEFQAEWDFIRRTLDNVADEAQLVEYEEKARRALDRGERLVFMPTFWALGNKPESHPGL